MLRRAVAVCMGLSLLAPVAAEPVPVRLVGEVVFLLRHAGDADDVGQRASEVSARLSDMLLAYEGDEPPLVEVGDADGITVLLVNDAMMVRVYPEDLGPEDAGVNELAGRWRVNLEAALMKAMPTVMDLDVAPPPDAAATTPPSDETPAPDQPEHTGEPQPIMLGETVIARMRHPGVSGTIARRAAEVNARLDQVLAARTGGYAPEVVVERVDDASVIYVGSLLVIRVFEEDAAINDSTPAVLAGEWRDNLAAALAKLPVPDAPEPTDALPPDHDPNAVDGQVIHVMVSSAIVARIRACGESASTRERGALIDARITDIISWENCVKPDVRVVDEEGAAAIYVGSRFLMRVYPADAAPAGQTYMQLARVWRGNLLKWLPKAPSMAARPGSGQGRPAKRYIEPAVGDAGRVGLPPWANTGLVVDASGFRTMRSIYPRIVAPDGREVWGTIYCSAAWAVGKGTAAWVHGLQSIGRTERAGGNPLVVRATKVLGPARCVFQVSAQDVRRIHAANRAGHFLESCNVVIVQ